MKTRTILVLGALGMAGMLASACAAEDSATDSGATTPSTGAGGAGGGSGAGGDGSLFCDVGEEATCKCFGKLPGETVCQEDGWAECVCDQSNPVCGDDMCFESELCTTCPTDCGECEACDYAPTCTGAFSIPSSFEALPECDNNGQSSYACGDGLGLQASETNCRAPLLKMRLAAIDINKNGDLISDIDLFCMVESNDGQSSEIILTPQKNGVGDDENLPLTQLEGTFWGQDVGVMKMAQFNITVTYRCYKVTDNGALTAALDAVAAVAAGVGAVPGNPYGWAFSVGAMGAAAAAAAANAANGAEELLSVTQTIDSDALLTLTNGKTWTIRAEKDNGIFGEDMDWRLIVQAWGCSTKRESAF